MSRAFYHEHPETLTLEVEVLEAEPGRVRLSRSPFYTGGGGQLADRGRILSAHGEHCITAFEDVGGRLWHVLADRVELKGTVQAVVDADFRWMMSQLHTGHAHPQRRDFSGIQRGACHGCTDER